MVLFFQASRYVVQIYVNGIIINPMISLHRIADVILQCQGPAPEPLEFMWQKFLNKPMLENAADDLLIMPEEQSE